MQCEQTFRALFLVLQLDSAQPSVSFYPLRKWEVRGYAQNYASRICQGLLSISLLVERAATHLPFRAVEAALTALLLWAGCSHLLHHCHTISALFLFDLLWRVVFSPYYCSLKHYNREKQQQHFLHVEWLVKHYLLSCT